MMQPTQQLSYKQRIKSYGKGGMKVRNTEVKVS